ncbi:unnamed protein product [Durusdinium trenchii]
MKVEEFHQRLQCFRDVFKAVVTDGHAIEDLQPSERDCWSRTPPWVAADLEQEQLEREIALKEHLTQGKSGREEVLEEQLASMQRLLHAKDSRIESLEAASQVELEREIAVKHRAAQGKSGREEVLEEQVASLQRMLHAKDRRIESLELAGSKGTVWTSGRRSSFGERRPSVDHAKEVPSNRREAHGQVMRGVKELVESGQELREAEAELLERHLQDFEGRQNTFLEKLKALRSEVRSEVDALMASEAANLDGLEQLRGELEDQRKQVQQQKDLQQDLQTTLDNERARMAVLTESNEELLRACEERHRGDVEAQSMAEKALRDEEHRLNAMREALEREYQVQQQQLDAEFDAATNLLLCAREQLSKRERHPPRSGISILWISVTFRVRAETDFGDDVYVVGHGASLGTWKPQEGVLLRTHIECYPVWFTTIQMPLDVTKSRDINTEYKFVIKRAGGQIQWEDGPNRLLPLKLHPDMTMESLPPHVAFFGQTLGIPEMPQPTLAPVLSMSTMATMMAVSDSEEGDGIASPCSSLATLPLADSEGALSEPKEEVSPEPEPVEPSPTPEPLDAPALVEPAKVTAVTAPAKVKTVQAEPESIRFEAGAHRLSKPSGRCEDAFFFSTKAAGVADGVGQMEQFSEYGVDAAKYADELMQLSAKHVHANPGRPIAALMRAERDATSYGACTALVMAIDGTKVQVANLGDSGFMHLRPRAWGMEILQTSREQTHGWNCPYQLTRVPEALFKDSGISFDSAADCEKYELKVEQGMEGCRAGCEELKAQRPVDLFTYSALLGLVARKRQWRTAQHLLEDLRHGGLLPDVFIWSGVLSSCERHWMAGLGLFATARSLKKTNTIVYNSVLSSLMGRWFSSLALLDAMRCSREEDTTSFNSVMTAQEKSGLWPRAMQLLGDFEHSGLQPDIVSLNALLAADDMDWRWALFWLDTAQRWSLQTDAVSFSSAISTMEKAGRWLVALQLLHRSAQRRIQQDIIMFNATISACEKGQQWERALAVLEEACGLELLPDVFSYGAAASACEGGGHWVGAAELLEVLQDSQQQPDTVLCNAVISALQKGTCWQRSLGFLEAMQTSGPQPDVVSYTAAMSACEKASEWQRTLVLLQALKATKAQAGMAFNVCISACERSNQLQQALRLLREMRKSQLEPDGISVNSALRACERASAWVEALHLASLSELDVAGLVAVTGACASVHAMLPRLLWKVDVWGMRSASEANQLARLESAGDIQRKMRKDHTQCAPRLTRVMSLDGVWAPVVPLLVTYNQSDLLLLFTDGLTDNLHWYEVLRKVDEVVERYEGQGVNPEVLASVLAKTAEERSHDTKANTPFAQSARRHRLHFPGGKEDDITVVAAWIAGEEAHEGQTDGEDVTIGTLEQASARKTCVLC